MGTLLYRYPQLASGEHGYYFFIEPNEQEERRIDAETQKLAMMRSFRPHYQRRCLKTVYETFREIRYFSQGDGGVNKFRILDLERDLAKGTTTLTDMHDGYRDLQKFCTTNAIQGVESFVDNGNHVKELWLDSPYGFLAIRQDLCISQHPTTEEL